MLGAPARVAGQAAPAGRGAAPRRAGGFVPGQQRPPGDPAQIARGKTMYGISCTGCHGADLRGGDLGGPNLLRSQIALSDQNGELIVPIIQGSRQNAGMPAIPMSPEDAGAWQPTSAALSRPSDARARLRQWAGAPASWWAMPARAAYFGVKCVSCHSATGDLQGIATRISGPQDAAEHLGSRRRTRRTWRRPRRRMHPSTRAR